AVPTFASGRSKVALAEDHRSARMNRARPGSKLIPQWRRASLRVGRCCGRLSNPSNGSSPMEIVPLGPGFAAELRGVTLAEIAADAAAYKEARAALEQHSVIVFRGQEVTDEAQLAFSRRFGPLEVTKVGSLGAGTHLVILSTSDESGKVVPADHGRALRNRANQLWHTDSPFKRVPALASVLSARVIPALGGETEYVSTRLAWERLEEALRQRLENSFA